jgi:hypothetical protein
VIVASSGALAVTAPVAKKSVTVRLLMAGIGGFRIRGSVAGIIVAVDDGALVGVFGESHLLRHPRSAIERSDGPLPLNCEAIAA